MSTPLKPAARWPSAISQADIPANNNARRMDLLLGPAISATETTPPGSPADGDIYIIPAAATGIWSGATEGDIAAYYDGTYTYFTPTDGFEMYVQDEGENWQFIDGSGWAPKSPGSVAAEDVTYDNAASGLTATEVQAAIDELAAGGGGLGDVVGPASSTNSNVALFDGVTGKLLKDGGALGTAAFTAAAAYATAAQGTTADSAVQPGDLATIATSGDVGDLTGFPGGTTNYLRADGTFAAPGGGGGGSPGGSDTEVQFNDSGSFGGDSTFNFNKTTNALSVPLLWWAKGTDIARAGTTSIAAATGNYVHLTGTTTITSFGAGTAGQTVFIRFAGAGTLTHNATSLILPGGANITTAANDCCIALSEGGSNWRVVSYTKANGQAVVVGAVSITGWTQSLNTASPNNTTNASRLLASGGTTNQIAVVQPKGNGGFSVNMPDGTSAGGDVRGNYSFDGQLIRTASTEIASGSHSVVLGAYNTASGNAAVAIGYGCQVTGAFATAVGSSNTVSADYAFAAGQNNVADGEASWISGGFAASVRGIHGAGARASGFFAAIGDCQDRQFMLRVATTNATPATVVSNASAAFTNNQIVLPNNSAFIVKGTINVREDATGDCSAWDFTAHIKRGANAAATEMVAACTPTLISQSAGAASWTVAVDADTTDGCLRCRVTGQASHNLKWGWSIYSCNELVG